ncbi:tyrosine-type recombinase/integrase [Gilvimarinus polysaccharolyticus]|uniref:tyrosine-type recombinase/integrase n=1 Tax=Gilvimarinus polysaccharolyticus TaxID=863921 RepID=UPI000673B68E|nr:site-specific integrase [Gilvimarinus polysaccharolyticus]
MRMTEAAELYIALNVYQPDTADTLMRAAKLFELRADCAHIESIDLQSIMRFRNETLKVAKPVTYNGYLRYLKLLNKWLFEEGYSSRNWFSKIKAAPLPMAPPKIVSEDGLLKIIHYLKNDKDAPHPAWFWLIVIRFLYFTGVRRRQIVAIEFQDLDIKNHTLTCSYRGSKTYREWVIPLADELIPDLEYLMRRTSDVIGRELREGDKLFNVCWFYHRYKPDPNNPRAMRREQVTGFMRRLSNKVEVRVGAHRIRHTTATVLCNPKDETQEPDIFAVQRLLGHTQLSTTRNYVETKVGRIRTQVNRMSLPK